MQVRRKLVSLLAVCHTQPFSEGPNSPTDVSEKGQGEA